MTINLELYKAFAIAAKHLSYTKAADELFVTQSAISQSIRQLETQLETTLFYKAGRGVALTQEGQLLQSYVDKALLSLSKGEEELRQHNRLTQGTVSLGASDTISRYYLLPYIKAFHEQYPGIQLSINNRPSPVSLEMVRKGLLDFAVINASEGQVDPQLNFMTVAETQNIFVASHDYAENHGFLHKKLNFSTLIKHPLITLEEKSTTRRLFERYLSELNIQWKPSFEGGSVDFILEMVAIGMGVGFIPGMALGHWKDTNLLTLTVKNEPPSTPICIVTNQNVPISRAAEKLITLMKSSTFVDF